jgi:hypothetical protein
MSIAFALIALAQLAAGGPPDVEGAATSWAVSNRPQTAAALVRKDVCSPCRLAFGRTAMEVYFGMSDWPDGTTKLYAIDIKPAGSDGKAQRLTFTKPVIRPTGEPFTVAARDVDGDGVPDLIVTTGWQGAKDASADLFRFDAAARSFSRAVPSPVLP